MVLERFPLDAQQVAAGVLDRTPQLVAEVATDGTFTQHDLHFLKSLRISVEGEAENASESDTD